MFPISTFFTDAVTTVSNVFTSVNTLATETFNQLSPSRAQLIQALWSRDPAFLNKIRQHADEKMELYNQHAPHQVSRHQFVMADGCKLHGMRFTHPEFSSNMILFGGTQQYCEYFVERAWTLHRELKTNVYIFDIRGTHQEHHNDPTEEVLIQDGIQIVKDILKNQPPSFSQPILYGTSLGGGISLCVAAELAKEGIIVQLVNERSYRSLLAVAKFLFPGFIKDFLTSRILKNELWVFNAEKAIQSLQGNHLIVIYHPDDYFIPPQASLIQALKENPPNNITFSVIEMKDDDEPRSDFERELPPFILKYIRGHNRPLNPEEVDKLRKEMSLL